MKKMTKLFGVLLSAMLVVSMFAMATPVAAADPGNIQWASQSLPGADMMLNGSAVSDIAVGNDGGTIYVADGGTPSIRKSTNGGQKFSNVSAYPGGVPISIAVAPDDVDSIAVIDAAGAIHTSNDAGGSWSTLPAIAAGTPMDIAIGPARSGTALGREYFVAVADATAATVTNGDIVEIGDTLTWTSSVGALTGTHDFMAVAVSPGYLGDRVVVAIGAESTTPSVKTVFINTATNSVVRATTLDITGTTIDYDGGATNLGIVSADIALPNDFDPTSGSGRVCWVGIYSLTEPADNDVYRIEDDSPRALGVGPGTGISSVSYSGTIDEGVLVAGEWGHSRVSKTEEPDKNDPDWSDTGSPTGTGTTIVRFDSDYADSVTIYAGTTGGSSAFCISVDGLAYFGESLINNGVANNVVAIDDIAITPDGETIFMATNDGPGNFSLWRSSTPSTGTSWSRISERSQAGTTFVTSMMALNPDYDNDPALYWAVAGTAGTAENIYVSQNGGNSFTTRNAPSVGAANPPTAIALEDDQTVYFAGSDGKVYKSTNASWTWNSGDSAKVGAIANLVVPMSDWLLVGGTGKVSYSDDGADSFTAKSGALQAAPVVYVVAADEDFADNNILYAATNGGGPDTVYRFEIGETVDWENLGATGNSSVGIGSMNGTLYSMGAGAAGLERTLNPGSTAGTVAWQTLFAGAALAGVGDFDAAMIDGDNVLYAARTTGTPTIWAYNDWLATEEPNLTSPPNNFELSIDPVNGRGIPIDMSWEQMGSSTGLVTRYDVQITDASIGWSGATLYANQGVSGTNPNVNSGALGYIFLSNKNYEWRVRANTTSNGETTRSPWSSAFSISVQSGGVVQQSYEGPVLTSPAGGAQNVNPGLVGFSWASLAGATEYQIIVATDAALTSTVGGTPAVVTGTSYQVTDLEYGTTYFYSVMATEPTISPQNTGSFTTMTELLPPVTVEPQPTPTIIMPDTSTPAYIWAVIAIGAVLVIAVIVLIVRTRRVS